MNLFKIFLTLISLFILNGCVASVPLAADKEDLEAKQFSTKEGKSNIYIYMHETFGGSMIDPLKASLYFDSKNIGNITGKTYFKITTNPGTHHIVALSGVPIGITIHTQPYKNYFIWQEVRVKAFDIGPTTQFHSVSNKKGMEDVFKCKLIKHINE
jgi:hypothetical protein